MSSKIDADKMELQGIPVACRSQYLYSQDKQLENETADWLKERGSVPLWSRLKCDNCAGQSRGAAYAMDDNYDIEIPGRLLSLFGSINDQTLYMNHLKDMKGYQLLSNIFALCVILKENFRAWSADVLNEISSEASLQYQELLQKLALEDKELRIQHLNHLCFYIFNGVEFKTQLQQVATGFVYIRYGVNEFNLARVLPWFFRQYQFGLIQCANRTLAIGQTLDSEYAFFMYDCQSCGYPLFQDQQTSSYILRTNHMQVLLYCLTLTLNVTTQVPFVLYNADLIMAYPLEKEVLKKEEYVPIIGQLTPQISEKQFKPDLSNNEAVIKNTAAAKTTAKVVQPEKFKIRKTNKKLLLDPDKIYYIIAVPKDANSISAKLETKQLLFPQIGSQNIETTPADNLANVPLHVKSLGQQNHKEGSEEGEMDTMKFITNTETVAGDTAQVNILKNPNNLGFKVYLVDEIGNGEAHESNKRHKIKIAHQLKDFFTKKC